MAVLNEEYLKKDWGSIWDCIVDACFHDAEICELLDTYTEVEEKQLVNCVVQHFMDDSAIRNANHWGLTDTPVKDSIHVSIRSRLAEFKPYVKKYAKGVV